VIPIKDGENPPSARHWYGDALHDPRKCLKEPPSETRIQMMRFIYPAEKSQGKWNKTIDSGNSKGWKSDGCLKYSTKTTTRILLKPY
jgi:hypothetical protein